MRLTLKYVNEYRDRHGHLRRYFRRPGKRQIPLPGDPGSPEFLTAYNDALASTAPPGNHLLAGSVNTAIAGYYKHNTFLDLGASTRQQRRAELERFRTEHGDKRLAQLRQKDVAFIVGQKSGFAAHNLLKTLRGLMTYAVSIGLIPTDPTAGIARAKVKAGSIHTWTEDEIARYESHWPVGSKPRLAFAMMLYTAQRRSDVIGLGPQHIRNGILSLRQQKTGAELEIPVHPELAHIIAGSECGHLAFLTTEAGAAYTTGGGLGNRMREWCDAAGLPDCSSHGLRKAACRRLAEAGCSAHEIMAISGHKTLAEAQRYTAAANKTKLAQAAIARLTFRT
jgi:integrase